MRHIARGREQLRRLGDLIAALNESKRWAITVTEHKSTRSLEQNDRFHALVAAVASETGNDPKWLKEWVKTEFGPRVAVEIGGAVYEVVKPTHSMDVAEMGELMNRLEAWCATELGIAA